MSRWKGREPMTTTYTAEEELQADELRRFIADLFDGTDEEVPA